MTRRLVKSDQTIVLKNGHLVNVIQYEMTGTTRCAHNGHNSINNIFFLDLTTLTCFLVWFLSAVCLREWGHKAAVGRRQPPWSLV